MSYVDPKPEPVKNPKTFVDLIANEVLEHASSVSVVYGLPSDRLDAYKKLCFDAAKLLNQASEILIKEGDTPTTIVIDKTSEPPSKWVWGWETIVRPVLVSIGAIAAVFLLTPGLGSRIISLFQAFKLFL